MFLLFLRWYGERNAWQHCKLPFTSCYLTADCRNNADLLYCSGRDVKRRPLEILNGPLGSIWTTYAYRMQNGVIIRILRPEIIT